MAKFKTYDVSKYRFNPDITSTPQSIADFLDWGAKNSPGTFFQPAVILQAIRGLNKPPRSNSQEIDLVRGAMGRAHHILMEKHNRGLTAKSGIGYRATIDSEDVMATVVDKKLVRFNSSRRSFNQALDLVNPKEIPATEKGKALKAQYYNLRDITKVLFSTEWENKLLRPADNVK